MINNFQYILFPQNVGFSATKSIERLTEVQNFLSGKERRNARKYHSKCKYDIGIAAKNFVDLAKVTEFFEARRGPLVGFLWHDILDCKSCQIDEEINADDQLLGVFDGTVLDFQLIKAYGSSTDQEQNYLRKITKPKVAGVKISIDSVELDANEFFVDPMTGLVTLTPVIVPAMGSEIAAGYEFEVPVRFEDAVLQVNYKAFNAGEIAKIALIEILD